MSKLLSDLIHKGVRPKVPAPQVDGRVEIKNETRYNSRNDSSSEDESYVEEYIRDEMRAYAKAMECEKLDDGMSGLKLDDLDDVSTELNSEVYRLANNEEIYEKYNFEATLPNKNLTIHSYKEQILGVIKANPVVIIDGRTGCGKTTQVPQYILDDCRVQKKSCTIVVTQPRKIATINVAKRVCQERGWTLGTVCGYQIGLEKEIGPDVILTYMTTGVLLQKLIGSKNLNEYSHIIVDEVHERNQDLDFLLLVIRKLLFTKCYHTKVILMSATINAEEFAHYFRTRFREKEVMAPIVAIRKPNQYHVTEFYIDNLQTSTNCCFDENKPEISEEVKKTFLFILTFLDKLDETNAPTEKSFGSVLVFLPGIHEIEDIQKMMLAKEAKNQPSPGTPSKWLIIPLHSSLPNDEQAKVFKTVKPPTRKIILSTNLAESSITVPDISFVIDFCLTKNLVVDKTTKFSSLQLEWASHVSCEQRAGRVGRVCNGRVYRLVPREFYESCLPKKSTPEIMRAPLENVVLHAKRLELNEEPKAILALSLNPPNLSNIEATVWHLKEIGALLPTCKGRKHLSDGDITFLGTVMSALPLEVCLSKLIVLGHLYSVLHEAIIMAAGCSIHNIFSIPFNERFQAYNKKMLLADGSCSDLIALLNLYMVWLKRKTEFRNQTQEYLWCKENLVNFRGLREWQLLISEIQSRLKRMGIEESSGMQRVNLSESEKSTVLKVIICGAFYPNYFIKSTKQGQIDEKEAVKVLGGRDPYKTVYLTGIDPGQPSGLYSKEIKKILDLDNDAKVEFDGSSKIYVEFKDSHKTVTVDVDGQQLVTTISEKIAPFVYKMVKKRMLNIPFFLDVLPREMAWEHFHSLEKQNDTKESYEKKEYSCFSLPEYDPFPSLDTKYISVIISHRIDAGHFYCQNIKDCTQNLLEEINRTINSTPLNRADTKNIKLRNTYAVKYKNDDQFYRGNVQLKLSETLVQVIFIDYGNIQNVKIDELYVLPNVPIVNIKPLALECVLAWVGPNFELHQRGIWSEKVNQEFDEETRNAILYGKIFSIVDEVIHLELFKNSEQQTSINQWLISRGLARQTEESFLSKQNNELRISVQISDNPHSEAKKFSNDNTKQKNEQLIDFDAQLKGMEKYCKKIQLKGPFSPLEMKMFAAMCNNEKSVSIEPSSVNSVLLDNNILDPHTRLMVAASINQSASGDRVSLRQTTMMPNLPGFPFLMALLFCPEMEPKLTPDKSRVSSILCGLGVFEKSTRPCYPAHDLVLTLDVELNVDIINSLNNIRYSMNSCLEELEQISEGNCRAYGLEPAQRTLKNELFQLFKRKLKPITPCFVQDGEIWKTHPENVRILEVPEKYGGTGIWPLHWFYELHKIDEESMKLLSNLETMDMIAKRLIECKVISCELCDKSFYTVSSLANHLINPIHKKNEFDLKMKLKLV